MLRAFYSPRYINLVATDLTSPALKRESQGEIHAIWGPDRAQSCVDTGPLT